MKMVSGSDSPHFRIQICEADGKSKLGESEPDTISRNVPAEEFSYGTLIHLTACCSIG